MMKRQKKQSVVKNSRWPFVGALVVFILTCLVIVLLPYVSLDWRSWAAVRKVRLNSDICIGKIGKSFCIADDSGIGASMFIKCPKKGKPTITRCMDACDDTLGCQDSQLECIGRAGGSYCNQNSPPGYSTFVRCSVSGKATKKLCGPMCDDQEGCIGGGLYPLPFPVNTL